MISFDPIPLGQIILALPMPVVVSIGIWKMVQANNARAQSGEKTQEALEKTQEALKTSVDALRELLERDNQNAARNA